MDFLEGVRDFRVAGDPLVTLLYLIMKSKNLIFYVRMCVVFSHASLHVMVACAFLICYCLHRQEQKVCLPYGKGFYQCGLEW